MQIDKSMTIRRLYASRKGPQLSVHPALVIVPTRRNTVTNTGLLESLLADEERLCVLQAEDHASPLRIARVTPRVHGRALHAHVSPVHEALLAGIKDGHHAALGDDSVVEGLGAMHHALFSPPQVVRPVSLGEILSSRGRQG